MLAPRRGIARRLLNAAEDHVRSLGVSFVSLEVIGDNEPALALYRSEGYVEVSGDSPADMLMAPLNSAIRRLPGWMRGTILLRKELRRR